MRNLALFSLLVVGGESVLLPALHLNLHRRGGLLRVMALAIAAAVLSDLFWYGIGRWGRTSPRIAGHPLIARALERSRQHRSGIAEQFEVHWRKLLVLSKFVYGTRTSAQVICGITQRPLLHYLAVNALGTSLLVLYLGAWIALFARGFDAMQHWQNVVSSIAATLLVSFLVGKGVRLVLHHRSGV
ncbi:MAG: VTT domain-containing protein [Thermoanaerobaculia bacterium]|nr:VTT domain-containing protein [Thermoanaerobaculia bacterium]